MNSIVALVRKGTAERVYHVFERRENLQEPAYGLVAEDVSQARTASLAQMIGHLCARHSLLLAVDQVFDGDGAGRHLVSA